VRVGTDWRRGTGGREAAEAPVAPGWWRKDVDQTGAWGHGGSRDATPQVARGACRGSGRPDSRLWGSVEFGVRGESPCASGPIERAHSLPCGGAARYGGCLLPVCEHPKQRQGRGGRAAVEKEAARAERLHESPPEAHSAWPGSGRGLRCIKRHVMWTPLCLPEAGPTGGRAPAGRASWIHATTLSGQRLDRQNERPGVEGTKTSRAGGRQFAAPNGRPWWWTAKPPEPPRAPAAGAGRRESTAGARENFPVSTGVPPKIREQGV